jgi:ribosomal protein L40E
MKSGRTLTHSFATRTCFYCACKYPPVWHKHPSIPNKLACPGCFAKVKDEYLSDIICRTCGALPAVKNGLQCRKCNHKALPVQNVANNYVSTNNREHSNGAMLPRISALLNFDAPPDSLKREVIKPNPKYPPLHYYFNKIA